MVGLLVAGQDAKAIIVTMPTPTTSTVAPLMITAYKTDASGSNLLIVEIYNDSKTIQNMGDWSINATTDTNEKVVASTLMLTPLANHYIEPETHITLDLDNAHSDLQWVAAASPMTSLQMSARGFSSNVAHIGSVTGNAMYRTLNASGYSTAKSAFTNTHRMGENGQPSMTDIFYDDGFYAAPNNPVGLHIIEVYPYSSSCSPFDTSILCGDYIKLANDSHTKIILDDYVLRTDNGSTNRTSSNTFTLSGELNPGEVLPIYKTDAGTHMSLTNSGGYIWIEDRLGITQYVDTAIEYASAGSSLQGLSYAQTSAGAWQWTSTPMPFSDNIITQVAQTCAEDQYFNPDTNRCRSLEDTLTALTPCQTGYERNAETNRCRKIADTLTSLTPCKAGQIRNPATNRCKSDADVASGLTPCQDGYERNPATNRCRKTGVAGASSAYPVEPYQEVGRSSAMYWAIGGIAAAAVGYGVWEWRQELGAFASSLLARMYRK